MRRFQTKAYAKINLLLNITGKRDDGYHTLETIMQQVSLCDLISITETGSKEIRLKTNLPYLPCNEKNLAWKAAVLFFEQSGVKNPGISINIKKNIPVGAGMAGGSTDAAGVLRLLNRMYRRPFSHKRLLELGLSLGADVPFCLSGGTMLAEGVGERLRPVAPMPDCAIVICKPPFSVSTKRAYELIDQEPALLHPGKEQMLAALKNGDWKSICKAMGNSMEAPIAADKPVISQVKGQLLDCGAEGAVMTGSGAAVFGLFSEKARAARALDKMAQSCRESFLAFPRNRVPSKPR